MGALGESSEQTRVTLPIAANILDNFNFDFNSNSKCSHMKAGISISPSHVL